MKRSLITKGAIALAAAVVLFIAGAGAAFAQDHKVEITPFGGYMLGGSIKFYEGKFKVENAGCYGGMLAVQVKSGNFVELSYTGISTQGTWKPYSGYIIDYPEKTVDLSVNYFQIGSVNEIPLDNESIRPYGTASLGATWFHPKGTNTNDEWLFSVAAGLGLKYFFNEKIGIRVQARLLLPLVYGGAGFGIGVGTGGASGGVYVSSTAPIVQGDFTGGIVIALGQY
jgi:hypothetical protein